MAKTLIAQIAASLSVKERADSTLSPSSDTSGLTRIYDQYNLDVLLNGDSYPQIGGDVVDLSSPAAGAAGTTSDFDLTAAPWAGDTSKTVDKTGKKLVAIIIQAPITNNAAGVTFGPQGGNGYALFGASKTIILYPGATFLLTYADPLQGTTFTVGTPAVAAGAKDLRFTGTAADKWKCQLIFSE